MRESGDSGSWLSIGGDPHFELVPTRRSAFAGVRWIRLEFYLEVAGGPREAAIYWNDGGGYSEQKSHKVTPDTAGRVSFLLPFPEGVKSIRLDPTDRPGGFVLRDIRVSRITRSDIFSHLAGRYVVRAVRHPDFYLETGLDLLRLWRRDGFAGVRDVVRQYLTTQDRSLLRAFLRSRGRKDAPASVHAPTAQPLARKLLRGGRRDAKGHRIAIGLVEHIGDIVACEPVVRHLRSVHPTAEISWVVKESYRELIDSNPLIDQTIAVDCLTDWIKLVAHGGFDQYVDLHVNGRICQCCVVPLRKRDGNTQITGETYFDYGSLLSAFSLGAGLPALNDAPQVHISPEVKAQVDTMGLPEKYVVLHCSANEDAKNWTTQNWLSLAAWLRKTYGLGIVEVGLESVVAIQTESAADLCGKTSLLETAEVLRRAQLFVGVDSGPAHMANAVGTPGVVLLGSFKNFPSYNPFSGGYADGSRATLLRNPEGPARLLPYTQVQDAVGERLAAAGPAKPVAEISLPASAVRDSVAASGHSTAKPPKLIAFYLPQFHPIPENDANWGKGFTEWHNVGKSRAWFDGQQQPRVPTELGYYDLRLPFIMDQQAELAREHGVHGFCYYYYWFEGRRLLHVPIDNMLRRRSPDFPFCFCWANENWTKRWDGAEKQVLVRQHHTPEDDRKFIQALIPAFEDPRYIRVDGKPVLLVYRTELFPSPAATADLWRNEVRRAGIGDLYLVRCEGFDPFTTPADIGFDAAYEVPSFYLPEELRADLTGLNVSPEFEGRIFDYEKIVKLFSSRPETSYKRHRGVMLAWDNTPRYGKKAVVFNNVTTARYETWLSNAIDITNRTFAGDDRLVFVNAWNEWAEGSYLEPDLHRGRAFLEATRRVMLRATAAPPVPEARGELVA